MMNAITTFPECRFIVLADPGEDSGEEEKLKRVAKKNRRRKVPFPLYIVFLVTAPFGKHQGSKANARGLGGTRLRQKL